MKYIIMADGKGTRWANYKGIPKHFIKFGDETLLERLVRQLHTFDKDPEVIITSHDKRYEIKGATRYEPLDNNMEIDRFTYELISDNICFLYGDTYYSDEAIKTVINNDASDILFFGNSKSIVAIKIADGNLFKHHVDRVKELYLNHKINDCKGWQVYQSFQNLEFGIKSIKDKFIRIDNDTTDYNTPEEYERGKVGNSSDKKIY